MDKPFALAVWHEIMTNGRKKEVSGVVATNWIKDDKVYWPPVKSTKSRQFLMDGISPANNWRSYELVKVKGQFGKIHDAMEVQQTQRSQTILGI